MAFIARKSGENATDNIKNIKGGNICSIETPKFYAYEPETSAVRYVSRDFLGLF